MVHGVRLENGKAAWYRNRWVRTPKLEGDLDAMDPAVMTDRTASAANTHVIGHAGRILALEEGHFPFELSERARDPGLHRLRRQAQSAFTAHPKLCPETNELHFFGYGQVPPYLVYHVLDAKGDLATAPRSRSPGRP